ncbi:hypothetical protein AMS68_000235 [Peltaster fructicola]|uniref:RNA helicase n=1 Tax=Peltaster fructicola TaxID=286661 RepID=A0A6H0XJA1_9PEZI|nr:hypothetical protein AMS68_000235 [Peltaster fructicola]
MKRKLNEHDVPEPVTADFAKLGLDARLVQAVANEKHATPTPIQAQAIPLISQGKSVLARAKTGSGKTLAYLLPILHSILARKTQTSKKSATTALILVPTKELATQVAAAVKTYTKGCSPTVQCVNIARKEDGAVIQASLATQPDIVVATPEPANQWIDKGVLKTTALQQLVIDEADLVLSYDCEEDLQSIAASLTSSVQSIFMSATLNTELDSVTALFCKGAAPTILDLTAEEATDKSTLAQYVVSTAEDEKFLLIYAIFKLQLIKGKIIVFVADVDRCYRIKLFLEQFGVRSCVLNSELPVNSRLHVVEEFNRGIYDVLVAADDNEVIGDEAVRSKRQKVGDNGDEQEAAQDDETQQQLPEDDNMDVDPVKRQPKQAKKDRKDKEYGVARGIDFRRVACVLNFDLPTTSRSYTHRIGRTARAGQKGMALSFYVPKELYRKHKPTSIPQCENDEKVLAKIKSKQEDQGASMEEWQFDMDKLAGFRYRLVDALRAVTRIAVRQARTRELRQELINSAKLQRHFEEHPEDLTHLRHDTESHTVRQQAHLKHIPDYLLPTGGKAAIKKDVGFVGLRSSSDNRIRKSRAFNKTRGKGRLAKGKGLDPLKSFNAKGRGKK